MKRVKLIRHLKQHGCSLLREGSDHTIFVNPANNRQTCVPRHREIRDNLAKVICRQVDIPKPH